MQLNFGRREEMMIAWIRVLSMREVDRVKKYLEDKNHLVWGMDWKMRGDGEKCQNLNGDIIQQKQKSRKEVQEKKK